MLWTPPMLDLRESFLSSEGRTLRLFRRSRKKARPSYGSRYQPGFKAIRFGGVYRVNIYVKEQEYAESAVGCVTDN